MLSTYSSIGMGIGIPTILLTPQSLYVIRYLIYIKSEEWLTIAKFVIRLVVCNLSYELAGNGGDGSIIWLSYILLG